MRALLLAGLLAGCIGDSDPHYNDEAEPWHVTLTVSAPVAFAELAVSCPHDAPCDRTQAVDPPATSTTFQLSFELPMSLLAFDTDVAGVHYHGYVVPMWSDYPNPLSDQTLHRFEGAVTLFEHD